MLPEPQDELVEFVGAWRGDLNPSKTLIRSLLANPDFADLKGTSAAMISSSTFGRMSESMMWPRSSMVSEGIGGI